MVPTNAGCNGSGLLAALLICTIWAAVSLCGMPTDRPQMMLDGD